MKPNYKQLLEKYINYIIEIHADQHMLIKEQRSQSFRKALEQYMELIFQEDKTDYIFNIPTIKYNVCEAFKFDMNFTKEEQKTLEELSNFIGQTHRY